MDPLGYPNRAKRLIHELRLVALDARDLIYQTSDEHMPDRKLPLCIIAEVPLQGITVSETRICQAYPVSLGHHLHAGVPEVKGVIDGLGFRGWRMAQA